MNREPKQIVFKYTIFLAKAKRPKVYYASAFSESNAREALAKKLDVNPSALKASKKNVPYQVRQALYDKNNKDYQIFVECTKEPEQIENVNNLFDKRRSELKSTAFGIKALLRQDSKYMQNLIKTREVSNWNDVYTMLEKNIKKWKLGKEMIDSNLTFTEALHSYLYPPVMPLNNE